MLLTFGQPLEGQDTSSLPVKQSEVLTQAGLVFKESYALVAAATGLTTCWVGLESDHKCPQEQPGLWHPHHIHPDNSLCHFMVTELVCGVLQALAGQMLLLGSRLLH